MIRLNIIVEGQTDLDKFHHYYIGHKSQLTKLKQDVSGITNPELINDNPANR